MVDAESEGLKFGKNQKYLPVILFSPTFSFAMIELGSETSALLVTEKLPKM